MSDLIDEGDDDGSSHGWDHHESGILIVPAKTTYVSVKGDSAHAIGDEEHLHSDHEGRWYDPQLFTIPAQRIPFGPLIQDGYIHVRHFEVEDWKRLVDLLGADIPEAQKELVTAATSLFVNSVVLYKRMASWSELAGELKQIILPAKKLLAALEVAKPGTPVDGALPSSSTIGTHISLALGDAPYGLHRINGDLTKLIGFAEAALQASMTGPGTGAQSELRIFLTTLADVADVLEIPTRLPGHDTFASVDPNDEMPPEERVPPPFFRFVREALRLANEYGAIGISKSALPQEEKTKALKMLYDYSRKSDKALSKQLQRIRKALADAQA
jgi:hypothetical protein